MSLADSHAWQTHLPDTTTDDTFLLNQAHVQYQSGTGGNTVDKPAETLTSIRLASHLVRAPNSSSRGHEFNSPMPQELGVLNKIGKTLGVRSVTLTRSHDHVSLSSCVTLTAWHVIGRLTCPTPRQKILLY
jgi:hypothetical protein